MAEFHVKLISVVDLVLGVIFALMSAWVLFFVVIGPGPFMMSDGSAFAIALFLLGMFFGLILGLAAWIFLRAGFLLLIGGRGGRKFAIAACILQLLAFPVGTVFGIYGLVILNREQAGQPLVP